MNPLSVVLAKISNRLVHKVRTSLPLAYWQARWIKGRGKKLILFTKLHPIYADFAYHHSMPGYAYLYFHPAWLGQPLGRRLFGMADILHGDAAFVNEDLLNFRGRILIECEAAARPEWFSDKRIASVIFQSRYAARRSPYVKEPLVLYPALPLRKRRPAHAARRQPFTFVTVGYGCLIKGYDVSFAVFQQLKQKGYNVKLVIAGKSEHNFGLYPEATLEAFEAGKYGAIEDYAALFDDLELRPYHRQELFEQVYPSAFALLHFSRMETFGYTVLEAMSFGLPVISVRFKAIPEMVEHGVNGFLCDPFQWNGQDDIDEMRMNLPAWREHCVALGTQYAEQLILNRELYEAMSAAARERFNRFSAAERARKLLPLLQ